MRCIFYVWCKFDKIKQKLNKQTNGTNERDERRKEETKRINKKNEQTIEQTKQNKQSIKQIHVHRIINYVYSSICQNK